MTMDMARSGLHRISNLGEVTSQTTAKVKKWRYSNKSPQPSTSESITCHRHQYMEQNRTPAVSFIRMNWCAKPLICYRVIVDLISATTTETGLEVRCEPETKTYRQGTVASEEEMSNIKFIRDHVNGEWNYTIRPSNKVDRSVNS
jgi:hypothetical protein